MNNQLIARTWAALLLALGSGGVRVSAATAPATSSTSGTVVDESGQFVAGAKVRLTRLAAFRRDAEKRVQVIDRGASTIATADSAGSFAISGLVPGLYSVCASGVQENQISGCEWVASSAISLAAN